MRAVREIVQEVPEYTELMTINELVESSRKLVSENTDIAELVEAGSSRANIPVYALIIHGVGEKRVLAFAFPHPNEPIGSLTLEFLSWKLVKDRELLRKTNATWIIVKVADVFGVKLNEGWFKGPFNIRKYVLNYYRPPPWKQVEWSFPFEYKTLKWDKPIPETEAIMKLIDEWKPTHIYSLHNAGFTGTYYYVTKKPNAEVLEILKTIPKELKVPIHKGEPEAPYMEKIDEAVFKMPSLSEAYDWLEKYLKGKDPAEILKHGGSSYDYARKVNPDVFELICEVPYIYDNRLDIDIPIGIPRREILRISLNRNKKELSVIERVKDKLSNYVSADNPFYESLDAFVTLAKDYMEAEENWINTDPTLDRSATVAEAFDSYLETYWSPIFRYGLAYRAIRYEKAKGIKNNVLNRLEREVLAHVDECIETLDKLSKYEIIPVRNLVQIQVAAIISSILT